MDLFQFGLYVSCNLSFVMFFPTISTDWLSQQRRLKQFPRLPIVNPWWKGNAIGDNLDKRTSL